MSCKKNESEKAERKIQGGCKYTWRSIFSTSEYKLVIGYVLGTSSFPERLKTNVSHIDSRAHILALSPQNPEMNP